MKITWVVEGKGAGSAEADDVDTAARALSDAVSALYAPDGPGVQAQVLTALVAPLRASLVTDGRFAVERGQDWVQEGGGIWVMLSPS